MQKILISYFNKVTQEAFIALEVNFDSKNYELAISAYEAYKKLVKALGTGHIITLFTEDSAGNQFLMEQVSN